MHVLVTGADGFVGSNLVRSILERTEWQITATQRTGNGRLFFHERLHILNIDLAKDHPKGHFDRIYSLAATGDPQEGLANPQQTIENDSRIAMCMVKLVEKNHCPVIHLSSNEAKNPREPYGIAKSCQDAIITGSNVNSLIVYTQSLFGCYQQRSRFIPTVIRKILNGDVVEVQGSPGAWSERPWFFVEDLAACLVNLVEWTSKTVSIASPANISNLDVALMISEALERPVTIKAVTQGSRPGHQLVPDRLVTGFEHNLGATEHAIHKTAKWYAANCVWL